ncbi:MAG TPA: hypothetical protein VHI93_06510 [Candidatus Thermoplasmatota archaeon]|nr:hypothetical protein [Candidatus Thermoplasmatota archaeon]
MNPLRPALALACLLLAGCFQAGDPAGSGTSSQASTTAEETRDPNAPSGQNAGARPLEDVEANLTGEVADVLLTVNNSMERDAFVFIGFRPRSLVPEAPCNLMSLRVPALSHVEVRCRLNLLDDGMLVMGAEWFERPNATIAMAVVRHISESGPGTEYHFEVQILPYTAMMVNRKQ